MKSDQPEPGAKITPERFKELSDLANAMIAYETAYRMWLKLHAQRRAIQEVAKGI